VNAVEMTDAVQVVTPPRWSETVTTPSGPAIVVGLFETGCDPRETLPVGALIERLPAVSAKVAVVVALADVATPAMSAMFVVRTISNFRMVSLRVGAPAQSAPLPCIGIPAGRDLRS
jgi:hypothetical protein